MSALKRRLNLLLRTGKSILPEEEAPKPDFVAQQRLREQIKNRLRLSVTQFCRTKADFDYRHGLVYKLLRTNPARLRDSTLCSHDVAFWLRDHKHPSAALWIIRLAGPSRGAVSRNQLLQWLRESKRLEEMRAVYRWTRKWGFKDTDYTQAIVARPESVAEARELYKTSDFSTPHTKQIFGNQLLQGVSTLSNENPEHIWAFFRTLNKDLVTLQTMLGAMIKNSKLRIYRDELWSIAERQNNANNIKIDDKLRETYQRVKRLPLAVPHVDDPQHDPQHDLQHQRQHQHQHQQFVPAGTPSRASPNPKHP